MFEFHSRSLIRFRSAAVRQLFFCLVACLMILPSAQASVTELELPAEDSMLADSTADVLFDSSGLRELLQQIPTSTASSFELALTADQLPHLFAEVDRDAIRRVVNGAFKSETFDKYLVKELQNTMSRQAREAMVAWYSSPLGAKARQAELDNSLLTEQERFIEYQTFLSRYPVSSKREQLILNLDYTMKSTESAVDMMTNIQMAFNLSLSRFMPEEQRLSRQEIQAMAKQNHEHLLSQYEKQTHDVLLFTYQSLTDAELGQLDDLLATDAGQTFVVAINNGIKKGMFAASLDLGDGLGALVKYKQPGPGI